MNYDKHIEKLLDKADTLKQEGKYKAAIKLCEKILGLDLNCVEAYEEIGDNYISLRDLTRAKKALDHAVSLDPESANAHYLLGFLASCQRKWKSSIESLELADELRPNHPEVLRCLGFGLYSAGQRERGIILLERARALLPNDVFILTDLGTCYLTERKLDKALEAFQQVLEVDPQNKKARDCLLIVEEYSAAARRLGRRS